MSDYFCIVNKITIESIFYKKNLTNDKETINTWRRYRRYDHG